MSYASTLASLSPTASWTLDTVTGGPPADTIADVVGSNDLTIPTPASVTTDQDPLTQTGRSILFSGSSGGYLISDNTVATTGGFGCALWFSTSAANNALLSQLGGSNSYLLAVASGKVCAGPFGSPYVESPLTYNDGEAHLAAYFFEYDDVADDGTGTGYLYIDGVLVDSGAATRENKTAELIFAASFNGGNRLVGTLDELAYWQGSILSASDVARLYAAGVGGGLLLGRPDTTHPLTYPLTYGV